MDRGIQRSPLCPGLEMPGRAVSWWSGDHQVKSATAIGHWRCFASLTREDLGGEARRLGGRKVFKGCVSMDGAHGKDPEEQEAQ